MESTAASNNALTYIFRKDDYKPAVANKGKPFLKWAGGKGQLLAEISAYYPFGDGHIDAYVEPFIGGGAVLFDILKRYELSRVYISDTNEDLIVAYKAIRDRTDFLVEILASYEREYIPQAIETRKTYYLEKRHEFNELRALHDETTAVRRAALLIFLNKTCFNGLYRVNKQGIFNVPMGIYKRPLICDAKNLYAVAEKLKNVTIACGSYVEAEAFIDYKTFVYLDPPYRPLTKTAAFTAYTDAGFDDTAQLELGEFVKRIAGKGAKFLLSNGDPKNIDDKDNFFDDLYRAFKIRRVEAKRAINSKGSARGKIKELLISNF